MENIIWNPHIIPTLLEKEVPMFGFGVPLKLDINHLETVLQKTKHRQMTDCGMCLYIINHKLLSDYNL